MNKDTFYPLGDRFQGDIFRTYSYRAKWTGEKRPPKEGEWYLSGAIIEAYRAPINFPSNTEFHIAKIVKVRKVEYWEEVKDGS